MAYLDHWKITVRGRDGYSDKDKESVLLSKITENGIRNTGELSSERTLQCNTVDNFCLFRTKLKSVSDLKGF